MENPQALEQLQLTDAGKLLFTFEAAQKSRIPIPEEKLDTYVYLLNSDRVLGFSYSFRFEPLPSSQVLRDDVYNLVQASFLGRSSPLWITQEGQEWVLGRIGDLPAGADVLAPIGKSLASYAAYDAHGLFGAVYARAASVNPNK